MAEAGWGIAIMGQAGAVPTPTLNPRGVRDGGDSAVGRPQTPGEGGETGGRGAGVSTPGKDTISRGAGGAAGPKNRMSCSCSAPSDSAPPNSREGRRRSGRRSWGSLCSQFSLGAR